MGVDAVRRPRAGDGHAELGIGEDDIGGDDAVGDDPALRIDVVDEQVDRPHALLEPFGEPRPFARREDPGDDIERDDPLGRFLLAIDGEGDAQAAEGGLGRLLAAGGSAAGQSASQAASGSKPKRGSRSPLSPQSSSNARFRAIPRQCTKAEVGPIRFAARAARVYRYAMTTELTVLAWSVLLAIVHIWLPVRAKTRQYGVKWNMSARDEAQPPLNALAGRLERAQINYYESFPLFAAAILIVSVAHLETRWTAIGAILWLAARAIYLPLYAFGVPGLRTLVWTASLVGLVMVLWPALAATF